MVWQALLLGTNEPLRGSARIGVNLGFKAQDYDFIGLSVFNDWLALRMHW
ncbi:hypothetical protein LCGC14_0426070 [marine sediment metagenome]|uniref:Uncharacterized protein n=1 Tax=marine sediment metagenome TaxID=412755 RepID=A0A0F9VBJ5_9ZZZZ